MEVEESAPMLGRKEKVVDGKIVDVYTTGDNHLSFSIKRNSDNKPADVSRLQGFHYVVRGDAEEILIAGTDDSAHGVGHIVELDGDMRSSHFGTVDVFDAKTGTALNDKGEPRSKRMQIDM